MQPVPETMEGRLRSYWEKAQRYYSRLRRDASLRIGDACRVARVSLPGKLSLEEIEKKMIGIKTFLKRHSREFSGCLKTSESRVTEALYGIETGTGIPGFDRKIEKLFVALGGEIYDLADFGVTDVLENAKVKNILRQIDGYYGDIGPLEKKIRAWSPD